jgi:hypothetical protein
MVPIICDKGNLLSNSDRHRGLKQVVLVLEFHIFMSVLFLFKLNIVTFPFPQVICFGFISIFLNSHYIKCRQDIGIFKRLP